MFKWPFKKKNEDRTEQLLLKFARAYAEGNSKQLLRSSISTITSIDIYDDDITFVSNSAAVLTKEIWRVSKIDNNDKDAEFIAGIFAMVATNLFSLQVGCSFELSAPIAIIKISRTFENADDTVNEIISLYNEMTPKQDKILVAIGNCMSDWLKNPSFQNLEKSSELFKLMHKFLD